MRFIVKTLSRNLEPTKVVGSFLNEIFISLCDCFSKTGNNRKMKYRKVTPVNLALGGYLPSALVLIFPEVFVPVCTDYTCVLKWAGGEREVSAFCHRVRASFHTRR